MFAVCCDHGLDARPEAGEELVHEVLGHVGPHCADGGLQGFNTWVGRLAGLPLNIALDPTIQGWTIWRRRWPQGPRLDCPCTTFGPWQPCGWGQSLVATHSCRLGCWHQARASQPPSRPSGTPPCSPFWPLRADILCFRASITFNSIDLVTCLKKKLFVLLLATTFHQEIRCQNSNSGWKIILKYVLPILNLIYPDGPAEALYIRVSNWNQGQHVARWYDIHILNICDDHGFHFHTNFCRTQNICYYDVQLRQGLSQEPHESHEQNFHFLKAYLILNKGFLMVLLILGGLLKLGTV